MTRPLTLIGTLALCAALLVGCSSDGYGGSDDGSDKDSGDRTTATTEANATTAPDATTPAGVELSGPVNDKGSADISDAGATPSIDIEADDSYFEPTFIKAAPGATVTVKVENEGDTAHTFTIDGAVDQQLEPGDEATVTVDVPESGSLRFFCDFHSGMGMQGAFYTG